VANYPVLKLVQSLIFASYIVAVECFVGEAALGLIN